MSVAIVDARGDYGAVIVSGVNREIGDVAVPAGAQVVVLQNEVPEAVNLRVAAAAGDARVVLNAAPAREIAGGLMARVDVLVVNRGEAAALAGVADPEAAAVALAGEGTRRGDRDAWGRGVGGGLGGGLGADAPAPKVEVVSTHGAGDAFTGALAARLAKGDGLGEALRFAQGAAALMVATDPERAGSSRTVRSGRFLSGL